MKVTVFSFVILCIVGCKQAPEHEMEEPKKTGKEQTAPSNELSFKATFNEEIGWGYQIYKGAKILIIQEHIPAINGLYGFETKEKAEIAAKFVLSRIKIDGDHPTVNAEELDSIGAINLDSLQSISLPANH